MDGRLTMKNAEVIKTIHAHVPSLSDSDDRELDERRYNSDVDRYGQQAVDNADLALRTCSCGVHLDGFYQYVDHLTAVFGGESHIGG
jgi:hypothetical protein